MLLTVLVGVLCRSEDFEEIEDTAIELLDWLKQFLPFENGIASAQTLKRTLARLNPRQLEKSFMLWVKDLAGRISGVVAIDGKTVRGSKQAADGTGALHLVHAWAHEAGLLLAQQAVGTKSNEITAIPELLDMLELDGAIVTIDAMGTQTQIADRIIAQKADYVLALKGNQGTLEEDAALFFADPVLGADCSCHEEPPEFGHGRIEEHSIRVADAAWLAKRHPEWKGLTSIAAVTVRRTVKKTGAISVETRLFISSLSPDPALSPMPSAPIGAWKTTCTGFWMSLSGKMNAMFEKTMPHATLPWPDASCSTCCDASLQKFLSSTNASKPS